MANSNEHIKEFLDYYLNKETTPDYAVLITGSWGSGKTYFIKKYLGGEKKVVTEFLTDCKKYCVVYVSLFGAKTREDMDARVMEKLHPILNSETVRKVPNAVSVIGNLIGVITGNPVSGVAGDTASFFSDQFIKAKKKLDKVVVVFDDVERANMRPCELLGYLNEYVEFLHVPCILLADKEKWEEAQQNVDDKKTLQNLSCTQEKVIGRTLKIKTPVDDILNSWLKGKNDCLDVTPQTKKIWWENRDSIYDLFQCIDSAKETYEAEEDPFLSQKSKQARYDWAQMKNYTSRLPSRNYRSLRQTLKAFDNLCFFYCPEFGKYFEKDKKNGRDFTKIFVRWFLKIYYGLNIGMFKASEMWKTRSVEIEIRENCEKENSLTEWSCFEKVLYKADSIDEFPMQEYLQNGCFDKQKVIQSIKNSAWFGGYEAYMVRALYHWWDLEDKDAKDCDHCLKKALAKGCITDATTLAVIFVVRCMMADDGYTSFKVEDVSCEMNAYLDLFSDRIETAEVASIPSIERNFGSVEKYTTYIVPFRRRLVEIIAEKKKQKMNEMEEEFFQNLVSEDNDLFDKAYKFIHYIPEDGDFSFTDINAETFINKFRMLKRMRRNEIIQNLNHRYLNVPQNYDYSREKEFMTKIKKACEKELEKIIVTPLPSIHAVKMLSDKIDAILNLIKIKEGKNETT